MKIRYTVAGIIVATAAGALGSLCLFTRPAQSDKLAPRNIANRTQVAVMVKPSTALDFRGGMNASEYQHISGLHGSQRLVGICELTRILTGPAGAYRVVRMTGVTEPIPELGGALGAFTYVELDLAEAWSDDAPQSAIARISGGPTADPAITAGWRVTLSVGELLGLVLQAPTPENKGYYGIHNLGVFQSNPRTGGMSNGQLFTETTMPLSALGPIVRRAVASRRGACAEIAADYGHSTPPAADQPYRQVNQGARVGVPVTAPVQGNGNSPPGSSQPTQPVVRSQLPPTK
jgi:hypothetical protein